MPKSRRAGIPALLLAALLGACEAGGVLAPQGPIGAAEKTILLNALVIMLAIVVPTIVATLGFAWWFRASNTKARHRPTWAYSGRIELLVWSIPLLVILFLGGIAGIGSYRLDPAVPIESKVKPLEIQVVSLDWKWLFLYPEQGIATVNQLTVPAGRPLHFSLTSSSVMNAFFVPRLGSMIYTMNGMTTQLWLQADREGVYAGRSSHYSGDGFSGMRFDLTAVGEAGFERWVAGIKGGEGALDEARYAKLAEQSSDVPPMSFARIDAELFHRIAMQYIAPAAGPAKETPARQAEAEHQGH